MEIPEEIKKCIQKSECAEVRNFSNQIKDLENENIMLSDKLDDIKHVVSMNRHDDVEELAEDIMGYFI